MMKEKTKKRKNAHLQHDKERRELLKAISQWIATWNCSIFYFFLVHSPANFNNLLACNIVQMSLKMTSFQEHTNCRQRQSEMCRFQVAAWVECAQKRRVINLNLTSHSMRHACVALKNGCKTSNVRGVRYFYSPIPTWIVCHMAASARLPRRMVLLLFKSSRKLPKHHYVWGRIMSVQSKSIQVNFQEPQPTPLFFRCRNRNWTCNFQF